MDTQHSVRLPWTRDRLIAEASTCTTNYMHTTETSTPPGGFRTRNPSKRAANIWEFTNTLRYTRTKCKLDIVQLLMYNPRYIHNLLDEFRSPLYRKCTRVSQTTLYSMEAASTLQWNDRWHPTDSIRCVITEHNCRRYLST